MGERRNRPDAWLDTATAGIRFGPDRAAVRGELEAHLEDKAADLQRIFPELTAEEARVRALEQMGDAAEIGRELAKIHRPWLGWLWRASRWAVFLAAAAAVLQWGAWTAEQVQDWWAARGSSEKAAVWYLRGEDPASPGGPLEPEEGEVPDVRREPVLVTRPGVRVRAGDYMLEVDRLALWQSRAEGADRAYRSLYFTLTAWGPPWQQLFYKVPWRIAGEDNLGNHYYSTYETHELRVERDWDSPSFLANILEGGAFSVTFLMEVFDVPEGAEWIRLVYDWEGTQWELTLPLTEEGEP